MPKPDVRKDGFSLVEVVLVIIIIGIVAAIAVPRLSRGAVGAAESALIADLNTLRKAVDLYAAEHEGKFPEKNALFLEQMTRFTDRNAVVSPVRTATNIFGPYLKRLPPLPLGKNKGKTAVTDGANPGDKDNGGWWYNENTGEIRANLKDEATDDTGKPYNQY